MAEQIEESDRMSASISRRPQLALFEGAPGGEEAVERRYTEALLAAALLRTRGVATAAARIVGCSATTIQKRLKRNPRLREVRRLGREILKDNAETLIADSIEQPCIYCGVPLLTTAQRAEECEARPVSGENLSRRHESFAEIDIIERLRLATWFLKTAGKDRGYGEKGDVIDIPDDLIARLPIAHLADLQRRLAAGQPIEDILLLAGSAG
jgi:regulatory Fis family protein